jgi:YVTN family beta-propeller protein
MSMRIVSRALLVVWLAATVAAPNDARAAPLLFVSADAGGEVVVVDPAKAQVVDRIKVGPRPRGLKLARNRKQLFVALSGAPKSAAPAPSAGAQTAGLAVVDIAARKVTKVIATPPSPLAVDVSPDGQTAYVANNETNELLVVNVAAGSVKKMPVGTEPVAVAIRPDGKVVYVATRTANELSAIDPKTLTMLARVDAGMRPQAIAFAARETLAFVPNEAIPSVTVVDLKEHVSKAFFMVQPLPKTTPPAALQSAVFSPDGKRLYVTTGAGRSVAILDPVKKTTLGIIDGVGAFPRGIAISADGKKLYTANGPSNDVGIIDVASKKVEARVAVPGAPWSVVFVH